MTKRKNKASIQDQNLNNGLTDDQLRQLFFSKCIDRDHLGEWIKKFWGANLPKTTVSRYSNCNPLDSVWDVYNHAIYLKKGMDVLYISTRGGGKTLGAAITESALMFHDRRGAVHIGAIEKQAKRAYSYFQTFLQKNKSILMPLVEKSVIEKTSLIVDNELVTLECLPATMSALNGPHEACVVMDELDTLSPEGLIAYKQINGIPVKHRLTGAPPIKIGISTRKSAYGLVQKQMDSAVKQGRSIKMWNQIDLMEKCYPVRHGTEEVTIYTDQSTMTHISAEHFEKLANEKRADYVPHLATEGCINCALFSVCLGDAKKQDPEMTVDSSTLILSIEDVITKVKGADVDWVLAELMCMKPSMEGIVFKEFDRTRHLADYNAMWKVLTNNESKDPVSELMFVKELHRRKVPIYGGIDWGWTAPSTFVAIAVDERDNAYILRSFGVTKTNDPTFIQIIKTRFHKFYRIQTYYPDNANGSGIDLMKTEGLPVAKVDKSENLGVQVIKRLMKIPGTSEIKLLIAKDTNDMLIYELERYHYETDTAGNSVDGKFAKEYDHCIDPCRYILTAVLGKTRFVVPHENGPTYDEMNPLRSADGSYHRAPTFHELAQENQIPIMVEESKPFNRADDDDEEGPSGFNWFF